MPASILEGNGIIPAYAGSTKSRGASTGSLRDHPRVCGEHRNIEPDARIAVGIIPAYAGSTTFSTGQRSIARDHPRVCGEHRLEAIQSSNPGGSSPRMRGALVVTSIELIEVGIIPAYAGSTRAFRN